MTDQPGRVQSPCCGGCHYLGCTDDPPLSVCCWRCPINPSESPEAFAAAIREASKEARHG